MRCKIKQYLLNVIININNFYFVVFGCCVCDEKRKHHLFSKFIWNYQLMWNGIGQGRMTERYEEKTTTFKLSQKIIFWSQIINKSKWVLYLTKSQKHTRDIVTITFWNVFLILFPSLAHTILCCWLYHCHRISMTDFGPPNTLLNTPSICCYNFFFPSFWNNFSRCKRINCSVHSTICTSE